MSEDMALVTRVFRQGSSNSVLQELVWVIEAGAWDRTAGADLDVEAFGTR